MPPPTPPPLPVMLELAPLPRTQVGPFLILGIDKDADREAVEAGWAERVKLARKGAIKTPLEDVNWAREMLTHTETRLRSDAVSLNIDTTDGTLRKLRQRFHGGRADEPLRCKPLDVEKSLADYVPPTPVPPLDEVRAAVRLPELPRDVPAVRVVLEDAVREPVDPWQVTLDA